MERKREAEDTEYEESKRPKIVIGGESPLSDDYQVQEGSRSRSPYSGQEFSQSDSLDSELFPLAKVGTSDAKKKRRYRAGNTALLSSQEKEKSREHRKHRSEREGRKRRERSPHPSSGSTHKGHEARRNVSSGHNSPHTYDERWQDQQNRERSLHRYQSERDEVYRRRGERVRHLREGRRGSGGAMMMSEDKRDLNPRGHYQPHRGDEHVKRRSRSPFRDESVMGKRWIGGRKEDLRRGSLPTEDQGRRYRSTDRHQEHSERSPMLGHQVESASDDEEEEEEGLSSDESRRPNREVSYQHTNIDSLLRDFEETGSLSGSSDGSVSDQEGGSHRVGESGRDSQKVSSHSDSSGEVKSVNKDESHSDSRTQSRTPPDSEVKSNEHMHIIRSKFDSDEDHSGDENVPPSPLPPPLPPYQEILSGDNETDEEHPHEEDSNKEDEAAKNRRLSVQLSEELDRAEDDELEEEKVSLPCYLPALMGCRNVESYEWLNKIEEGTYGVVHRAKDKKTGEIVALKKLKMEKEKEGFPITSLREINMLLKAKHPNVVHVKEIVVGSNMDKIFIVMEYVEHDLKALMETMQQPFLQGEVKTLMIQLLRAVHHLHDNWILHRDLKASNLLLSHKGILKVGDFGLAREYGSPLKNYTPVVVTLWYRAPELLLGEKEYSTAVDMWSVGCIFAEFLKKEPLFRGKSEIDQINLIFKELGTPNERIWPGYNKLPTVEKVTFNSYPYNNLRKKFPHTSLTESGFNLLIRFLTYDPKKRITALEALDYQYFKEPPMAVPPSMFPTWPAKSEMTKSKKREKSPKAPEGGLNKFLGGGDDERVVGAGFNLKF